MSHPPKPSRAAAEGSVIKLPSKRTLSWLVCMPYNPLLVHLHSSCCLFLFPVGCHSMSRTMASLHLPCSMPCHQGFIIPAMAVERRRRGARRTCRCRGSDRACRCPQDSTRGGFSAIRRLRDRVERVATGESGWVGVFILCALPSGTGFLSTILRFFCLPPASSCSGMSTSEEPATPPNHSPVPLRFPRLEPKPSESGRNRESGYQAGPTLR
jgi:hypothetical protein